MSGKNVNDSVPRYADMFSAMGTEPRLRIMRLLSSAHREGVVVGDIATELDIPSSTLSHHLENPRFHTTSRSSSTRTSSMCVRAHSCATPRTPPRCRSLLGFLYAEGRTRNRAIEPRRIVATS